MTRSSTPSNRPQTSTTPVPARERLRPGLASTAGRAGDISSRGRSSVAAASMARPSTSALITMPGPPPAGVSSTLRCLSVAKLADIGCVERPYAGRQRLAGKARAQGPGKNFRENGEDACAPHLSSPLAGERGPARREPTAARGWVATCVPSRRRIRFGFASLSSPARREDVNDASARRRRSGPLPRRPPARSSR